MSGGDYFYCPVCNTKALYDAGESEDMPDVEVLHRACLARLRAELVRATEELTVVRRERAWLLAGLSEAELAEFRLAAQTAERAREDAKVTGRPARFGALLADPAEQFDPRAELLASVVEYMNAPPAAASAQPKRVPQAVTDDEPLIVEIQGEPLKPWQKPHAYNPYPGDTTCQECAGGKIDPLHNPRAYAVPLTDLIGIAPDRDGTEAGQ